MKTYRLTYRCGARTFVLDVQALDAGRAELTGRLDLNEKHSVKGVARHYGMEFRGRYELVKVEERG